MTKAPNPRIQDTEKHLSQLPALHLLQKMEPRWRLLTREEAERERGGKRANVYLDGILKESLARINRVELRGQSYPFTENGLAEAIERLKRPRPSGLLRINEELTDLLLLGTAVEQTVDGLTRAFQVKFVDWADPSVNVFHVCAEFDVEREHTTDTRRPDLVLFVNGIPFAVIECKGPSTGVDQAVSQHIRNQQDGEIPGLFRTVQLLIATNKNDVRYGTVGTAASFWSKWAELEDREADVLAAINAPLDADQNRQTFADGFREDRASYDARFGQGDRLVTEQDRVLWSLARPERLLEGKDYGYIVDYCSVLGELNQALSSYSALEGFDEADLAGTVTSINTEIEKLGQRHSELWDVFRGVANTADEEALEQHLADEARRDEFYDRLNAFSRTLAIALSSHEFANEPSNQRRIAGYRDDLRRFENLRRAVRTRYQDAVDYGQYRKRIEKLLDTYVVADDVRPMTDLVNIFDEDAFAEVLNSNESAASRADSIAHATKRTIDERWEEDPTYYKRFSELIRQAIEDFRAKSISDLEYLKRVREIRDQMVRRDTTDIPEPIREDPLGRAFYGCLCEALSDVQGSRDDAETLSAEAAVQLVGIINSHRRVDWAQDPDVENAMKNDIDDYIFDVIRGEHNVPISTEAIDALIDRLLMVARRQAA